MEKGPTSHSAAILPRPQAKHEVQARPTPSLGPDDVLIKVTATAINPVDWKIREYNVFLTDYPAVLGSDGAGVIALCGSDVKDFAPGDRVFFQGIVGNYDASTFQKYCRMPAALVGKTPKRISDDEAAGVSVATVAVMTGLYAATGQGLPPPWSPDGNKVGVGKAAVVLGGGSSVGQYAIQLARLSGFERIITSSSNTHADYLGSIGATHILDRAKATAQDFKEAAGQLDVAFVQDAISTKDTQALGVEILKQFNGGNVITVLGPDEDAVKLGQQAGVQIRAIMGLGSNPALRHLSEPLMNSLGGEDGWIATGKFIPNRPEVIPGGLNGLEAALERNKRGASGFKVVIRPQDVDSA